MSGMRRLHRCFTNGKVPAIPSKKLHTPKSHLLFFYRVKRIATPESPEFRSTKALCRMIREYPPCPEKKKVILKVVRDVQWLYRRRQISDTQKQALLYILTSPHYGISC